MLNTSLNLGLSRTGLNTELFEQGGNHARGHLRNDGAVGRPDGDFGRRG